MAGDFGEFSTSLFWRKHLVMVGLGSRETGILTSTSLVYTVWASDGGMIPPTFKTHLFFAVDSF